jgi:hypothetical protein
MRKRDEERHARDSVFVSEFFARNGKQGTREERRGREAMREIHVDGAGQRWKTPLVVRGSLPRVFLTLGLFLEVTLLFCGSYLLADAILQPLDAGTFSVVGGGSLLGLATVLLFYLAWPWKRRTRSNREESAIRAAEPIPAEFEVVETQRQPNWVTEKKERLLRPM